ncbi:hypothetical protein JQ543_25255 [Bradyrhizobium diazoefficiens]|nr:hypothetical protein [Bradyrhizobium diazoefficiens]MBR0851076.1 hypothetical protein [Bradyrhizobium diazoefficiens]
MTPNFVAEARDFAAIYAVTLADRQSRTLVQHLAAALQKTYDRGRAGEDVDFVKEARGFVATHDGNLTVYHSRIFREQLALALQWAYDRGHAPVWIRNDS